MCADRDARAAEAWTWRSVHARGAAIGSRFTCTALNDSPVLHGMFTRSWVHRGETVLVASPRNGVGRPGEGATTEGKPIGGVRAAIREPVTTRLSSPVSCCSGSTLMHATSDDFETHERGLELRYIPKGRG